MMCRMYTTIGICLTKINTDYEKCDFKYFKEYMGSAYFRASQRRRVLCGDTKIYFGKYVNRRRASRIFSASACSVRRGFGDSEGNQAVS